MPDARPEPPVTPTRAPVGAARHAGRVPVVLSMLMADMAVAPALAEGRRHLVIPCSREHHTPLKTDLSYQQLMPTSPTQTAHIWFWAGAPDENVVWVWTVRPGRGTSVG